MGSKLLAALFIAGAASIVMTDGKIIDDVMKFFDDKPVRHETVNVGPADPPSEAFDRRNIWPQNDGGKPFAGPRPDGRRDNSGSLKELYDAMRAAHSRWKATGRDADYIRYVEAKRALEAAKRR